MDELFESFGLVRKLVNLPQPVSVFSGDMAPTADFERRDRRLVRVVDVRLEVSIPIGLQLVRLRDPELPWNRKLEQVDS